MEYFGRTHLSCAKIKGIKVLEKVLSYQKIIPTFFRLTWLGIYVLKVSQSGEADRTYYLWSPSFVIYQHGKQIKCKQLENSISYLSRV